MSTKTPTPFGRQCPLVRLLAAAVVLGSTFLSACGPSEEEIRDEIEAANYCSRAEDCVDVGGVCPFGCQIPVNEAEADHIRDLLEEWEEAPDGEACMYSCAEPEPIDCVAGECVVAGS